MSERGWLTIGALLVVAYFLGRSTAPDKIVTKVETVYVDKVVEVESKNQVVLERIRVTPSGESVTVRKIQTKSESQKSHLTIQNTASVSVRESNPTTVLFNLSTGRAFGLSVSRKAIGPLTIGVFGFSDGRAGASVGFQF